MLKTASLLRASPTSGINPLLCLPPTCTDPICFREHGAKKEIADGEILIDAIKTTPSIKTFIWSGLEPSSKISNGKFTKVEHFDTKVCTFLLSARDEADMQEMNRPS